MFSLIIGAFIFFIIAELIFPAWAIYTLVIVFIVLSLMYIIGLILDREFTIWKMMKAIIFILVLIQIWKWV